MPIRIGDGPFDIEEIQDLLRSRSARRSDGGVRVRTSDLDSARERRLDSLEDWNFPKRTWAAMWPPNLTPWNLEEDFPIESHRAGLGQLLVAIKRAARTGLRFLARPIVAQQVEINRTLSLMTRTLADELAHERVRVDALERRLARVTSAMRETRGDTEAIVVFEESAETP